MRRVLIVAALTLLQLEATVAAQDDAQQQTIKLAIEVTEPSSGVLENTYKQAFRALSDVQIVTPGERSQFTLNIVATCEDENSRSGCESYSLAIALLSQLDSARLHNRMSTIRLPDSLRVTNDQIAALAGAQEHLYAGSSIYIWHTMFVASYGRDRYTTAIQEFVAQLDAECFERSRLRLRWGKLVLEKDYAAASKVDEVISAAGWLCW